MVQEKAYRCRSIGFFSVSTCQEAGPCISPAACLAALAVLTLLPCLAQAQDTSRNYVKTVTMLDAGGTDSLQAVQYYNGLGWPTLSVATADADGGTACTLTTYDAMGRELRKYAPVPGSGLDYMTESAVSLHNPPHTRSNSGGFSRLQ